MNYIDMEKLRLKENDICTFILDNKDKLSEPELYIILIKSGGIKYTPLNFDILQILSKFDCLKIDFYRTFFTLLKQYKFLETNCLEIGSGVYPVLAEYVAPIIDKNGKRLTILDPRCAFDDIGKVVIKRELFTEKTDISKIDTLYGTFTCEASEIMVERAINEDKNLLVAFCSCNHPNTKYPSIKNKDSWALSFCEYIKEEYKDEIDILSWPNEYEFNKPIMVRMTEKQRNLSYKTL